VVDKAKDTFVRDLSLEPSLISECMAQMRDVSYQENRFLFRKNLEKLGQMMALEISKSLSFESREIQTPLGVARCSLLKEQPVIATILRAGLPMQTGFLDYFDKADACFVSAYRKHTGGANFEIVLGYHSHPSLQDRVLILCDPMLATGKSMVEVYKKLTDIEKPKTLHIACAVASKQGIQYVREHIPQAIIWVAGIDPELNDKFYIVPGLGDAGDLAFGEKEQH